MSLCLGCSDGGGDGDGDGDDDGDGSGEVEIIRDELGMVHIYAQNDSDLFWAAGYQMASDRLLQMDLVRRRALGRRAELMGEEKLEDDMLMRAFDFETWGSRDAAAVAASDPEAYALLQDWVDGVNARIEAVASGDVPTPYGLGPEGYDYVPEPWTVEHVFATAKLFMFGNSNSLEYDFLATVLNILSPANFEAVEVVRPSDEAFILPPADRPSVAASQALPASGRAFESPAAAKRRERAREAMMAEPDVSEKLANFARFFNSQRVVGSNNWAISGKLTASGKPIIANDPHQPIESPSVLYAIHLDSKSQGEGSFNVGGFGFAGTPGVQLGHNEHIHWAATTAFADVMDLWNVQRDGNAILVGTQLVDLEKRTETIEVAGAEATTLEVWEAGEYGILVPDFLFDSLGLPKGLLTGDASNEVLVNWAGFRETNEIIAFLEAGQAEDVDAYREAVKHMSVGGFNWMAADENDIIYTPYMLVPDRGDPSARQMPYVMLDGDDPDNFWTRGFLPDDKLPMSRNPKRGWIASANNDPFGFTADGDVHNDPWYYGALYAPGFRAARIEQEMTALVEAGKIDVEQLQTLQNDVHPHYADRLLPHLETAWANATDDAAPSELVPYAEDSRLSELMDQLRSWDRSLNRDASAAMVFYVWSHVLSADVTRNELGLAFDAVFSVQPGYGMKVACNAYDGVLAESEGVIGTDGPDLVALRALSKTANWLESEFGDVSEGSYAWGDRHGTYFGNQLDAVNQGWVPTDGGNDTINPSNAAFFDAEDSTQIADRWDSTDGPVFRFITTFDDDGTPMAIVNYPTGNSEDPDSPYFSNTLEDWVEGNYQRMPFRRAEVEAAEVERMTLTLTASE